MLRPLFSPWLTSLLAGLAMLGCGSAKDEDIHQPGAHPSSSGGASGTHTNVSGQNGTGNRSGSGDASNSGDAGSSGSKGGEAGSNGGSPDTCSGRGPIVQLPGTPSATTCTGAIAETRFLNALCTCNNATVAGYLRTRGFDSRKGPESDKNVGGGSVGINRKYAITTGYTDIGGSFTVAGDDSLSFAGYLEVGGNLKLAGEATVLGYSKVHRDAYLGGPFTTVGYARFLGDLHASSPVVALPLEVEGRQTQESISVPPPCACEEKDLLDVDALIEQAKLDNDNAAAGVDPKMFTLVVGDVRATLPCGRYYLEDVSGVGNVIVRVTGRVALFIDGSLHGTGNVQFELDPGAEIDIFIRNNLVLTGNSRFGRKDRPAATRLYVGGEGDVQLIGASGFVGNLYAPRSRVTSIGYVDVRGSIVARDFVSPGFANFVYDSAIQHAGDGCEEPPPPPGTCDQCGSCTGGTACVKGSCGTCQTDADCCSPLVCDAGSCIEPVVSIR